MYSKLLQDASRAPLLTLYPDCFSSAAGQYAHQFVRTFLLHGLPTLERCFAVAAHSQRVRDIIRALQTVTRFLHRLCCHSKSIQNAAIVAQIPLLRATVEALLVRVKAMLVANRCCTADIWEIANLKNKDLQGQVLIPEEVFDGDDDDEELARIPERNDDEEDDAELGADGLDEAESMAAAAAAAAGSGARGGRRVRLRAHLGDDEDGTLSVRSKNSSRSRVF